jgi:hypothetical protein
MLTCRMLRSYHLLQKMKARSLELTSDPTEVGTSAAEVPAGPGFLGITGG